MPIHDWTRVDAGIFHDFHSTWIVGIKTALNNGLLPSDYYALAEQIAGRLGPDVLTLQKPTPSSRPVERGGVLTLEASPPRTRFHVRTPGGPYATKAKAVAIRHCSDHRVVAIIEIVSPGNKSSNNALKSFIRKTGEALAGGIHLLVVDLFPPGPRDPNGLHPLIWDGKSEPVDPEGEDFTPSADKPLSLLSYVGSPGWEAFIEPVAVGDALPPMPLFLDPDEYVSVPLGPTYEAAWRALPGYWREVLTSGNSA